ncbi:MAG TPA: NAD(P)/FAD-dependent oxidoreductase [Candidatus Methylomirabilis sp.]|nr:NAD(P)/FAD-dependent oxidoreductase [Candidatus Methylomirabilis sp.]
MTYDLIVVGGGIAGASLAQRVAKSGAHVLVLEQEHEFRDRIRGECLVPWGVGEARQLGVAETLRACANEMKWADMIINGQHAMKRDFTVTTPQASGMWGFYHPQAQELLLEMAMAAGAEIRRGATVQHIAPGATPRVKIAHAGRSAEAEARLVAICAGRQPALRAQLGFQTRRGSIPLFLAGVWVTSLPAEVDPAIGYIAYDFTSGAVCALFPQSAETGRAYFGFHPQMCPRLQGDADFPRFCLEFNRAAGGAIPWNGAQAAGPLASFECVDVWVDHPYRNGVALLGDSAASNDPCWGQGLSLALRDARVLSDELLASSDWAAAADRYAARHDQHYGTIRTVSGWFHDVFQRLGPEADARRARAMPLIAQDPMRSPDMLYSGPDLPIAADARARFFGEDQVGVATGG